ncbi:MAG: sigma-70 family RNA polymerase sigma factor [Planctomycetia bacterium]|nr:sigma-70 family RNA polymerase sigma factor [Planctomycetia bacterium]
MPDASPTNARFEQLLVCRAQEGDEEAFRALIAAYERRLLFFLRRTVNDEHAALDLLQDVWLIVFRKIRRLKSPAAFRVWIYQIAHDRAVSQVRRERREDDVLEAAASDAEIIAVDEFAQVDRADLVRNCLDRLPQEQRILLTLRFLEDLDLIELAETVRVPVGTIKSRLHYAKQAMRQMLKEYEHG